MPDVHFATGIEASETVIKCVNSQEMIRMTHRMAKE